MRKCLQMLALFVASAIPCTLKAIDYYGIYVAGTSVTSDNASNIKSSDITSGTVVYEPRTNTLTFRNVEMNVSSSNCLNVTSNCADGLKIVLVGDNVFKKTGTGAGISLSKSKNAVGYSNVNIYIQGSGSLTMEGYGISCSGGPWLCLGNGVQGGAGEGGCRIKVDGITNGTEGEGYLGVTDAAVTLKGLSYKGTIWGFRNLFVSGTDMGIWTPEDATYDTSKYCLTYSDGRRVYGEVYLGWRPYGLTIGGTEVTAGNKNNIQSPYNKYSALSYNPNTGVLTLPANTNIYTFDKVGPAIANKTGKALTIRCTGSGYTNIGCNSADGVPAITSTEDVTITGTNSTRLQLQGEQVLNIEGETGKTVSIQTFEQVNLQGTIALNGGTLSLSNIEETDIDIRRYGKPDIAALKLENMEITTKKVFFDAARGYFRQYGDLSSYYGSVDFRKVSKTYGIWVGGHEVNNLNADNFYYENIEGSVRFVPDSLILEDATIDCMNRYNGIKITDQANSYTNVKLLGDNSIKNLRGAVSFVAYNNPVVMGPGSLTLETIYCYNGSGISFRYGCTINATQLISSNNQGGTLFLQDCQINLSGNSYGTLHGFDNIVMSHVGIVVPAEAEYDTDSRYLMVNGNWVTKQVCIGSITIDDITNLISAYLSPEAVHTRYGDMNGDGQIAIDDITTLINAYLNASDEPQNPTENGHEYVDLGLSVKWATMNIGANAPEEYGDYFAWGETSSKYTYSWSTYKFCKADDVGHLRYLDRYNSDPHYDEYYAEYQSTEYLDYREVLSPDDDAAYCTWGGTWRMPTEEEVTELQDNCISTWTTLNGVNGCLLTGPNGNSIFLPAAGLNGDGSFLNVGSDGAYWTSSLYTNRSDHAWFMSLGQGSVNCRHCPRYAGLTVRAVCP